MVHRLRTAALESEDILRIRKTAIDPMSFKKGTLAFENTEKNAIFDFFGSHFPAISGK